MTDSTKPEGSDSPATGTDQKAATSEPAATTATSLRPELQPIAARYGQELLDFALHLAGANLAIDWLIVYGQTHSKLKPQSAILLDSIGWSFNQLAVARGWEWETVMECLSDIGRASKLAHPAGNA